MQRHRPSLGLAAAILIALLGLLGTAPPAASAANDREAHAQALQDVPAAMRSYYDGFWYFSAVLPDPYESWTPPKAPVQFCYNDSYQGNSWRAAALAEYQKLVADFAKAGLAKPNLIVTNSNNNIDVQLSQLQNQIRQGCNVILSIPSSPTGLCAGVQEAHKRGVLFVSVESPVFCKEAINVDFNEYYGGLQTGRWLAQALGGKGSVVMLDGVPGLAPTVARHEAAMSVFAQHPGIKVVGTVVGMWTPSIAKSKMLQFLATHPQRIDGVWNGALMGVAAGQALSQSGRPAARINGFSGSCSFLAYWKQNHLQSLSLSQGGAPALYEAFLVAARMLQGQKPVVNTILYPLPEITDANLDQWYKPSMTVQSNCFADPPDGRAVADSYFDPLFKGGAPLKVALQP
ncbi:MAG TPA: substrate-binding domain-containing protein [Acetobacteraceae bacterium]|nr:substrate-binding domain-containing protein [Acetobacteraceae bacterium]